MPGKSFFKSKTLWVNALALVVLAAKHYLHIDAIPDIDVTVLAVVNFLLRFLTKEPVTF